MLNLAIALCNYTFLFYYLFAKVDVIFVFYLVLPVTEDIVQYEDPKLHG